MDTNNQKEHQQLKSTPKTIFKHIHVSRTKPETKTSQARQPKQTGSMIHRNNGFSLGSRANHETKRNHGQQHHKDGRKHERLGGEDEQRRTPNFYVLSPSMQAMKD